YYTLIQNIQNWYGGLEADYYGYLTAGDSWWKANLKAWFCNLPIFGSIISVYEFTQGHSVRGRDMGRPLEPGDVGGRLVGIGMDLLPFLPKLGRVGEVCFPAGTPVAAPGGPVPIESVRPGEDVWGFDLTAGEWVVRRVAAAFEHDYKGELVA